MTDLLPKSRLVKIEFTAALPVSATYEQVEEWVRFETRGGSMSGDNQLGNFDLEAISAPLLTDTHRHLHEDVTDNQDGTYSIRRRIEDRPSWGPSAIDTIIAKRPA